MPFKNETYFGENTLLHELITYYADKKPHSIALIYQQKSLTYLDLEQQSSKLAAYLQDLGVTKGDFVAIHLSRSLELIISLIAIQKAGAAYVPIDVAYPKDRVVFRIEDMQAKVVLTEKAYQNNIPDNQSTIICLQEEWSYIQNNNNITYQNINKPSDLAYMIYTSGSTGKPKGVMISHENVLNQLEGQQNIAPNSIHKMLLTCSISFDVSVLTIYWTFYQGATLVIPMQDEEKDIAKLSATIYQHQISHILTLPSLHTLILEQADPQKLQSLRLINVSGEVCPTSLAQKHERLLPNCQLYNLYGPTEATVNCTFFKIPKGFSDAKMPIGKTIDNYEIFILNKDLGEVGNEEVGEIYIGGSKEVVGKGYWNRPDLSTERFINNPFATERGGVTLYKTGDLAKWMPDGNIEFLGRTDFQVKFNGYRIELGEIETAINQYEKIKEVVVLLQENAVKSSQKLVAYTTVVGDKSINVSNLRIFLSEILPNYMIPAQFVVLEEMPLTPNGKFDRKSLPKPPNERPNLSQNYQAPQTDLEKELTAKWEVILGVNPIGRNDKFFELGGSSIQAAQFIGQLQTALNTSIFVTTIFDHPTISEYAKMLERDYISKNSIPQNTSKFSLEEAIKEFPKYIPTLSKFDKTESKNPRAIFILAPPRSGTSLLSLMLTGHPNLVAFNELKLMGFPTLKERNNAYQGKFSLWQEGLIKAIMELKGYEVEKARAILRNFEKENWTTKQVFHQLQQWANNQTIVDKTPTYALDLATLQKIEQDFENPIFIHLIRHPHSMVESFDKYHLDQVLYLKEHPYSSKELGELVWLKSHQNIIEFLKNIPSKQQFQLRYEDLIQQPEFYIKALCEKTGIDFHPNLLTPYQNIENKTIEGIHKDSRSMSDSHLLKFKTINRAKAEEWKKSLKDTFLSKKSMDLAENLGYKINNSQNHKQEQKIEKNTTDIAIIGMSCRVPGANTLHEFWTNLVNGTDVSQEVSEADLLAAGLTTNILNNPNYVAKKLSLDNIDCFDAPFFGYHPKEAELIDPQHRILLEVAYAALENSGYNPFNYDGNIGIFGGVARNSYFTDNLATHPDVLKAAGDYTNILGSESSNYH